MKTIGCKIIGILIFSVLVMSCKSGNSLSSIEKAQRIENKIDSANYTFIAQTALPMRGTSINLTSDYTLRVTKDTVEAYLPYFGRAYTAPMNATDGGIKFKSTDFSYTISKKKKGSWTAVIETNDTQSKVKLTLDIGDNGYTSLYVMDNNRQPISFYGSIKD